MLPNFFNIAKAESLKAKHRQHKLGAVLVYRKGVVAKGHNDAVKTHPIMRKYDNYKTLHAEVSAIIKLKNKDILKDCDMYIYRETKNGDLALSRPCSVCSKLLRMMGLRNVYFTTPNGWAKEVYEA